MGRSIRGKAAAWLERLTVLGAIARGFVYLVVGCTALRAAVYAAGKPSDFPGAFKTIAAAPMGRAFLVLLGAGLAAFALARVLEAILSVRVRAGKAWMMQGAGLILALIYGTLSVFAWRVAMEPSINQRGRTAAWAALVMTRPLGRWFLGIIGAVVIAAGVHQLIKAAQSGNGRIWVRWLKRYGYGTHALLLVMLGAFALTAGIVGSPGQARGVSGALTFLQHQVFGSILLAVFGLGLTIYGVILAIEAFRDPAKVAPANS